MLLLEMKHDKVLFSFQWMKIRGEVPECPTANSCRVRHRPDRVSSELCYSEVKITLTETSAAQGRKSCRL